MSECAGVISSEYSRSVYVCIQIEMARLACFVERVKGKENKAGCRCWAMVTWLVSLCTTLPSESLEGAKHVGAAGQI